MMHSVGCPMVSSIRFNHSYEEVTKETIEQRSQLHQSLIGHTNGLVLQAENNLDKMKDVINQKLSPVHLVCIIKHVKEDLHLIKGFIQRISSHSEQIGLLKKELEITKDSHSEDYNYISTSSNYSRPVSGRKLQVRHKPPLLMPIESRLTLSNVASPMKTARTRKYLSEHSTTTDSSRVSSSSNSTSRAVQTTPQYKRIATHDKTTATENPYKDTSNLRESNNGTLRQWLKQLDNKSEASTNTQKHLSDKKDKVNTQKPEFRQQTANYLKSCKCHKTQATTLKVIEKLVLLLLCFLLLQWLCRVVQRFWIVCKVYKGMQIQRQLPAM